MLTLYKATLQDFKIIKAIYQEAFPFKERKPFCSLKKAFKQGKMELIIGKDEDKIIGFGTCYPYKDMMYLDYLAMDKQYRGHGYGGEYLKAIFNLYKDKRICLIMERTDEPCDNKEQRVKRKQFYLHNGMKETGYFTSAISGNYEVLYHHGNLTEEEFIEIINFSLGRLFAKLAKYHICK